MSKVLTKEELEGIVNENLEKYLPGALGDQLKEVREEMANGLREELETKLAEELDAKIGERTDLMKSIHEAPTLMTPEEKRLERGRLAGQLIRAFVAAKGRPEIAVKLAESWKADESVVKALAAGTESAGGFLVQDEFANSIIELLRPASVVRSLNPITVGMDSGTLRMPKLTTGSSGGWIGENQNAPATQPVFGQVVLTAKKYASLVPISNDLLRRNSVQADTVVRDDLVGDIGSSTDLAFIRGAGTGGAPQGLANQSGIGTFAANGTVNLANVTEDLGTALQTLMDADVRMLRPGWIMEPRTWRYLITVRDGNGNLVFKPEMDGGSLFGYPFRWTSQIPRNLGGGTESELYLVDFADVVLGETTSILLDASAEAAYHDGSNVVAAFSLDQTVLRAIVEVDIGLRHAESVVLVTAVTWGV
jgi:HK97 family phage major capsid protein